MPGAGSRPAIFLFVHFFLIVAFPFQLNSYPGRRFHPRRPPSGQAVVTGVGSPFSPPASAFIFFVAHRVSFSIPTARRFSSNAAIAVVALASLALPANNHFFTQETVLTSMHSVRLVTTELIQATGDAGSIAGFYSSIYLDRAFSWCHWLFHPHLRNTVPKKMRIHPGVEKICKCWSTIRGGHSK